MKILLQSFRSRLLRKSSPILLGVVAGLLGFILTCPSYGQSLPYGADVQRPMAGLEHDYVNGLSETVNPSNGTLEIKIPFQAPPGRKLSIPFGMQYNSGDVHRFHSFVPGCGDFSLSCSTGAASGGTNGWAPIIPYVTLLSYNFAASSSAYATVYCPETSSYTFYDMQGGGHSLGLVALGVAKSVGAGGTVSDCNHTAGGYSVAGHYGGGDDQVQARLSASCDGLWMDRSPYPSDCTQAAPAFMVTDASGDVYSFPAGSFAGWGSDPAQGTPGGGAQSIFLYPLQIEDRNGNIVNFTYKNGRGALPIVDTLGRSVIAQTANGYQVGGLSYILSNTTASAQYNVNASQIPSNLDPRCNFGGAINDSSYSVLQTLTLPNGQAYTFHYNSTYGVVNEIDYPDGGWVTYNWGFSSTPNELASFNGTPKGANPPNSTVLYQACNYLYYSPVILSRTVGDGSKSLLQQTFSYSTTWDTTNVDFTAKSTTITTVDLLTNRSKQEVINYGSVLKDPPDGVAVYPIQIPVEATVKEYDWGNTTTPLRTTTKVWADEFQMTGETITWNNNSALTSKHIYCYSTGSCTQASTQPSGFPAPLMAEAEYDYSNQSTPIRQNTYTYYPVFAPCEMLTAMSNASPCNQVGVPSVTTYVPQSIVTTDGSGNKIAETDLGYDEVTPATVSNLVAGTHDECNFGVMINGCSYAYTSYHQIIQTSTPPGITHRGNLTSLTRWNRSGTSPITKVAYDTTGQLLSVSKPCIVASCADISGPKGTTTYSYTDNFDPSSGSGGQPASPTNAYLTAVTDPLGHTTNYTYALVDGLLTAAQDANGKTSYIYADPMRRLTETDLPGGGRTTRSYADRTPSNTAATQVATSMLASPDPAVNTTTVLDGFGRTMQNQVTSAPGNTILTDTVHDGFGNISSRSNPYQSTSDQSYGKTTYVYDALGRETTQINPDSTSTQTCYNGVASTGQTNCTSNGSSLSTAAWIDFSDEAGRHWQRQSDAFDRLVAVMEPDKSLGTLAAETDYVYDPLDDLTSVKQKGVSGETARTRQFTYDSLSHLITSNNPESGLTCYGTWSGGAVGSGACQNGYDLNGNLSVKTDANGMTLTYTYDALNRLVNKTAPPAPDYTNATMVYDTCANGIGRLCQESTPAPWINGGFESGTRLNYDPMGRVTGTQWFNYGAQAWQNGVGAKYDLAGNLTQITFPDGRVVAQTFDGAGRLASVADTTSGSSIPYINGGGSNGIAYWPSGAVQTSVLGDGVMQSVTLNNRLQLCRSAANTGALPAKSGLGNAYDRSLLYANGSTACGNTAKNNGNIYGIIDNLLAGNTQSFSYDNLNRLLSGSQASNWYNQNYTYDSFGNMMPHDNIYSNPSYSVDAATNRLAMNGSVVSGNLQYDAAGYLTTAPFPGGSLHSNTYTAEGFLRCIDSCNTGSYLTNGLGERTLAVRNNSTSNQYVYLNGQVMADLDQTGTWTDYIYANGQKIAKADGVDAPLHLSGVNCSNCGGTATYVQLSGGAGRKIQAGDVLSLAQFESGGAEGGAILLFTDGTATSGSVAADQNGQQANCDTVKNQWHVRQISLSAYAGKTLQSTLLIDDVCSSGGQFDLYFNDVSIAGNGSTSTIYSPQRGATFTAVNSSSWPGKATNISAKAQSNPSAPGPAVHFYLADQIGSMQMELAAGGWPVWQGEFTPFGQEIVNSQTILPGGTDGTAMRFKFTGKERDAESGLDYFGARYYSSVIGRFSSPDPVFASAARVMDPQQWNMYAYGRNNPLSITDPTGLDFNLRCSGGDSLTCQNGVQGQTLLADGGGTRFEATDVDMNKQGDPSAGYSDQFGNNYTGTFDQNNGVSFTDSANGQTSSHSQFIDGSDATQLSGSGAFAGIQGNFFDACGGGSSCQGRATLSGSSSAFSNMENTLSKSSRFATLLDGFSGAHPFISDQWKGGDGGYAHVIKAPGYMFDMHFEGSSPGAGTTGFALHMLGTIKDLANGTASGERAKMVPEP